MIVIPPVSDYNEWFENIAKTTWDQMKENNPELIRKVEAGNKTCVVFIEQKNKDGISDEYLFHYRMYVNKLYCFIEEREYDETKAD